MKVKHLREALNQFDGEHEVILASDAEGNEYNSADDYILAYAEGRGRDLEVDDDFTDVSPNAVVIYPV